MNSNERQLSELRPDHQKTIQNYLSEQEEIQTIMVASSRVFSYINIITTRQVITINRIFNITIGTRAIDRNSIVEVNQQGRYVNFIPSSGFKMDATLASKEDAARFVSIFHQATNGMEPEKSPDIKHRLAMLDELKASGIISDSEYQMKRAEILKEL